MPWRPLPRIAFAVATFPFQPSSPADLPLELGDELYIIEQGGKDGLWYRGYLVAPPSLLAGLTCHKGQTLEARVFSGIFPKTCVEVREELGEIDVSQKLGHGVSGEHNSGGNSSEDLLDAVPGSGDGQRAGDRKKPYLKSHESLKGLGLTTNQRYSQQRDFSSHSENGMPYGASPLLQPRSRNSTAPATPVSLNFRGVPGSKPAAPVPMLKIGDETPTSDSEPLVDEIASCLREWHSTNLHELLLSRQYGTLDDMSAIVSQLDLTRRQLLHDVLTGQERLALRQQAVWDLVRGNKMLSGEIIVRDPEQRGRLITGDDSAIEMTKLQSVMSVLDSGPVATPENFALHHLLLEIKGLTGADVGTISVSVSLCLKSDDGTFAPLSETFALEVTSLDDFAKMARSSKLKTLFTDLSGGDIGEAGAATNGDLYLIVRLLTTQQPKVAPITAETRPLSRNGTFKDKNGNALNSTAQDLQKGGRRSIRFGSIRKTGLERKKQTSKTERLGSQPEETPPAPISKDAPGPEVPPKTPKAQDVVRIIGLGLLDIAAIMRQGKDVDQSLVLWSPASNEEEPDEEHVQMFDPAIRRLLHSATGRYVQSPRASRLSVQLSPFTSADAQSLIRRNPTTMHMITQTQKIGFSEAPIRPRSDIYVTLSEAVVSQAALLSHPESGSVQLSRSSRFLNLQLTLEIRDGQGRRIENCIYPSSNSAGLTAWRTVVAEEGARWDHTICLKIPTSQVSGSHLIMSIAEAPEFPFALAWMPLWDQQAFIHDGHHSLIMHAYDRSTSSVSNGKGAYLSLPWLSTGRDFASDIGENSGHMATLTLESYLCSTEYSQDQVIIGLINWPRQSSVKLTDLLKKIVFVPEIEIVKQRNDVFDALFALLVHKSGDSVFEDLIFNDLITVLGIVHDRRFNLGPLVDQYAEDHFEFPSAAQCLIRCYTRLLWNTSDPQQSRNLRASFKVGRYIMKFIITARQQQRFQSEGLVSRQNNFNEEMQSIFKALENLMRNDSAVLVGSKTLLAQHFHSWLPELLAVFSQDEVRRIATRFMDSSQSVKGKLVLYRIILVLNYVQIDDLWAEPADRQVLMTSCRRWLAPYWGETDLITEQWREQVRLCASVVAEFLKQPSPALYDFMPRIVSSYCTIAAGGSSERTTLSFLFSKTYPFNSRPTTTRATFDEALLELAAVMSSISNIPPLLSSLPPAQELPGYITSTLEAQRSILEYEAYPEQWLSLHIYHHRSTLLILEHVSVILAKSFLPSPDFAEDFDMEIWKGFLQLLLKIVGSEVLALETFPEQKRRAVWKIAGDVRETAARLLRQAWDTIGWEASADENRRYDLTRLGGYQVQYVPSLVSPIVELCLSVHEGVRKVAVEILKTMIVSEWALGEDLGAIETEVIASLDVIFKTKRINESVMQKLFIAELLDMFSAIASQPDDALWVALKDLVATIDELMDLLLAAHGDSMGSSLHTLRLMDFMKDMQKEDIYVRYVHDLAQSQAKLRNSTEAGLALQLHADLYPWTSAQLLPAIASPHFPAQSAFDRKEAIYFEMIQHFEDGRAWLLALAAYKELADLYENTTFDFSKLARTQRAMGHINAAISKADRPAPRYFRVIYRGLGFPPSIREKQYIFECASTERMAAFTDRLQRQHPAAHVTQSSDAGNLEGQYIQVTSVSAQRDFSHPVNVRARLPPSIKEHLLTSNPSQFTTTTKRQTAGTNPRDHWVEKTVYNTAETFPNILRQSEVVSSEQYRLSAIQTAIERTWRKTAELTLLEKRAVNGDDPNNSTLTSTILQLLDSESSSGTCLAFYRQFLPQTMDGIEKVAKAADDESDGGATDMGDESDESPSPRNPLEPALYVALSDHAAAIKHCLTIYTRPSLQATGKDLSAKFDAVYPQEARMATPPSRQQERRDLVHRLSVGSDVHKAFVSLPDSRDGKISIEAPNYSSMVNGRVTSPDLSESGRRSRQSKSQRVSLQTIQGVTASLIPERKDSRQVVKPLMMQHDHSSQQTEGDPNGMLLPHASTATTIPHVASNQSTNAYEDAQQSSRATSRMQQESEPMTKRIAFFGGAKTPDAPAPMLAASDHAPALEANDQFGRSLQDGLGANISSSRFTPTDTYTGNTSRPRVHQQVTVAEEGRPNTAGSGNTSSTGKINKKRFSLLKLGKKKSGNSVSAHSEMDDVEER